MPVSLKRGVKTALRQNGGTVVLQVQKASDDAAAAKGLAAAFDDFDRHIHLYALDQLGLELDEGDTPTWTTEPIWTPEGPFIATDCHSMPGEAVELLGDLVVRHLQWAGVTSGTVVIPSRQRYPPEAATIGPVAQLQCLSTIPSRTDPPGWVEATLSWLSPAAQPDDPVWSSIRTFDLPTTLSAAHQWLPRVASTGPGYALFAGDPETRCSVAQVSGHGATMVLGAGGPRCSRSDLLDIAGQLVAVAEGLAPRVATSGRILQDQPVEFYTGGVGVAFERHRQATVFAGNDVAVGDTSGLQMFSASHPRAVSLPAPARAFDSGFGQLLVGTAGGLHYIGEYMYVAWPRQRSQHPACTACHGAIQM